MKVGLPPYQHFSNYSIEILENKSTWEQVQHLLIVQMTSSKEKKEVKSEIKIKMAFSINSEA
jgi:hypothetical protein